MTPARYYDHLCVYLRHIERYRTPPKRDWFQWLGIDPVTPQNPLSPPDKRP